MNWTLRWFGPHDPVPLAHLRQVPGLDGVVTALADVPAGSPWSRAQVAAHAARIEAHGLRWSVVESIPVSEGACGSRSTPTTRRGSIFGLPRIVSDAAGIRRVLDAVDSPANALTFCARALGARADDDLVAMATAFAPRIAFVHARNVRRTGARDFHETAHRRGAGDVDLGGVLAALVDAGVDERLSRDHGRMISDETGIPGVRPLGPHDRPRLPARAGRGPRAPPPRRRRAPLPYRRGLT